MPKDSAESKKEAPAWTVTVSLPALIRSGSTSSSKGYGPTPRIPFSDCSTTCTPSGRWFGMSVGRPMPRLTYEPSASSRAARAAIWSRVSGMSGLLGGSGRRVGRGVRRHRAHRRGSRGPDRPLLDLLVGGLLRSQDDDPLHEDP